MDLETYRELRSQARRLARSAADAEDLVQDTLAAALAAGRADAPWLAGTMRNLAAMQARTAVRRRRREALVADDDPSGEATAGMESPAVPGWLHAWPASLRRVAVLALHGLSADEIRWILALSPEAFRQRLSRIRKALGELPPAARAESLAMAYVRDPARSVDLQFGLIRRGLRAALGGGAGLATHDVDGHLLVIRRPGHTWRPGGNG
ncbi:RNA polymerase sigma factor [Pseudoxanthomonas sp. 22568]|uniref:RNA polymerase sigma factor n=1 Tax=Pseudoxanthomonas sp. 22568 TaxID=3453945 RepID=UPI00296EE0B8|nr:sigma-70 family RNA polymerase sigma factor [Pseudoxanthomonas japonensis]